MAGTAELALPDRIHRNSVGSGLHLKDGVVAHVALEVYPMHPVGKHGGRYLACAGRFAWKNNVTIFGFRRHPVSHKQDQQRRHNGEKD
jgi:hypothetical protein